MIMLGYLLATAVAVATGFCLLSLLRWPGVSTRPIYEQLALGYLVGIAVIGIETLLLGYLRVPATLWGLLMLQLVPAGLFLITVRCSPGRTFFKTNMKLGLLCHRDAWQWFLILLIACKLLYVAAMNLTSLYRSDDAFFFALGVAKATYYDQSHVNYVMRYGYPKVPGLVLHWFAVWQREWNEVAVNLAYFNYYLALLILFYENLRVRIGRAGGVVGVYLLSTFPILITHSVMIGYADLPMGIYLSFAGIYAYRYACDGARDDLVIAAIFTLIMPAIKQEGLIPYFFLGGFTIFAAWTLRTQRLKPLAIWATAGLLGLMAVGAVIALAIVYGDAGPSFLEPIVWEKIMPGNHLAEAVRPLLRHFIHNHNNWMLIGPLAVLALGPMSALFWNRAELVLSLYAVMLLGCFIYLLCISGAYQWFINGMAINRSFLQIIPVILFTVVVTTWLKIRRHA